MRALLLSRALVVLVAACSDDKPSVAAATLPVPPTHAGAELKLPRRVVVVGDRRHHVVDTELHLSLMVKAKPIEAVVTEHKVRTDEVVAATGMNDPPLTVAIDPTVRALARAACLTS